MNFDQTLDLIGNVTWRSGIGNFTYHPTDKHAVTAAGTVSYAYDAAGQMTSRAGSAITWKSFGQPLTIKGSGYRSTFDYTPDRRRWRQSATYDTGGETTRYLGDGLLERTSTSVGTHWKHLINLPSGQIQHLRRTDGTVETLYLTGDHLGSIDVVTGAGGVVKHRGSFAAYGQRRNATTWSGALSQNDGQAIANNTRRGYTGHEHLDNLGLVHMNGRGYDPVIGRFLSADPIADGLGSPGGFIRYAYVGNNPLSLTDPSGCKSAFPKDSLSSDQYPAQPNGPGIPTILVEGKRIDPSPFGDVNIFNDPRVSINDVAAGGTGSGGEAGDGQPTTDATSDPTFDKCVKDCRLGYEGAIQASAGAFGGLAAGAILGLRTGSLAAVGPAAMVGAIVGAATGYASQGVQMYGGTEGQSRGVSAVTGASVGFTANAFAAGGSATVGSALFGAASGVVGGFLPGAAGVAGSEAVGGFGARGLPLRYRAAVATVAAIVAVTAYQALDSAVNGHCEASCGRN